MNYAKVIDFVKTQTAVNGRPPNYPFRSRFEHTMRVETGWRFGYYSSCRTSS